ncbi:MAG: hypothetical protein H6735_02845 [Alphaproteobacteria bacterium]|nr:hypothetical protein [Alphaproteobacteria bacterium]
MADGWYHHGGVALLALSVVSACPTTALAAPPLLEQWVLATDRPIPTDAALVTGERRTDDDGAVWVRVLVEDGSALPRRGWRTGPATLPPPLPPGYRDPSSGTAVLEQLVADAPRAGLALLGTSVQGRPIEGAWFGQPPQAGAPTARVLADHHGDEGSAWEVALDLAARVATDDGTNPALTAWLDDATLWVVPYVNPDGAVAGTRENANGVDLNRNYDLGWSATEFRSGESPFSEPETRAVRAFAELVHPMLGLSLHAGATNLGWPWNYTRDDPPDAVLFEALAADYADTCTWPGFWVTQGADWYLTRGDTNDWAYGRQGVLDLTLELSDPKSPPADQLDAIAEAHLTSLLRTLSVRPDASGRVVDARTGRALAATIEVDGSTPTLSDPTTGRFHRMIPPGVRSVRASAPGYAARTVALDAIEEIALEPASVGDPIDVQILARAGRLVLPDGVTAARLVHPGAPDVPLTVTNGGVALDPDPLVRGAWSVVAADGTTWRNAVLVVDGVVTLAASAIPFDAPPGTRLFGFAGEERAQIELAFTEQDGELMAIGDAAPALLAAGGAVLAVDDGTARLVEERLVVRGGACDTMPRHRGTWLVSVVLGSLAAARSRRRR